MVLTKDRSCLMFLIVIAVAFPLFAHGYCFWKGGFTLIALKIHLFMLPITVLFFLAAYSIHRSLKHKLVITESGLLVEDFSPVEFPWCKIRKVSTKLQSLPRGGSCLWLVLHTSCDDEYVNPKILKLNKILGIDGVPVCNLATYSGCVDSFLGAISQRARNAIQVGQREPPLPI